MTPSNQLTEAQIQFQHPSVELRATRKSFPPLVSFKKHDVASLQIYYVLRSKISSFILTLQTIGLSLTLGQLRLFHFFFNKLLSPFFYLPQELFDEDAMKAKLAESKKFELIVDQRYEKEYSEGIEELQCDILEVSKGSQVDYTTKQKIFWVIRLATVVAAFSGSFRVTFFVSLIQFLAMPFSFFASIGYGIVTIFVLYTGPILIFPALTLTIQHVLPEAYNLTVTLSPWFLVAFLATDQLLCTICLFRSPKGKTAPMSRKRIFESVWYGFLNCKTYWLILLPICFGLEVPIVPWLFDAALGLSSVIGDVTIRYWEVLFYHIHRILHIKHVYQDAHRFHHHLHDCTAFDAHIFGSGAPEEWLILMTDVLMALHFKTMPASLNWHVLKISWYDKWGFHTRKDEVEFHEDNFHCDHHKYHRNNFGTRYPYDVLMKTVPRKLLGDNARVEFHGYYIERVEEDEIVRLRFQPIKEA